MRAITIAATCALVGLAAPWREAGLFTDLAHASSGSLLRSLPSIYLTPEGVGTAVAQNSSTVFNVRPALTMTPRQVAIGYAALITGRPDTSLAPFEDSPMTTRMAAAMRTDAARALASGLRVQYAYQPSGQPVYALRTDDGCALTIFSVAGTVTQRSLRTGVASARRYLLEELAIQPLHGDTGESGVKVLPVTAGGQL